MQGIHVVQNNRGTYLESTNGHMLGRLLIDSDYVENQSKVIIPLDAVKALSATGKKGNETLHFTVEGEKITVIEPDNSTRVFSAVEGCFPDTDRIIPLMVKDEDIKPSSYNITYFFQSGFNALIYDPAVSTTTYRRVSEKTGYVATVPDADIVISALFKNYSCSEHIVSRLQVYRLFRLHVLKHLHTVFINPLLWPL